MAHNKPQVLILVYQADSPTPSSDPFLRVAAYLVYGCFVPLMVSRHISHEILPFGSYITRVGHLSHNHHRYSRTQTVTY